MPFRRHLGFISIQAIILVVIVVIAGTTFLSAFVSAGGSARDKKRLMDTTQMTAALKLFFQENGFYPQSQGLGFPRGLNDYLDYWPTAPQTESGCTDAQNSYNYSPKSAGADYLLTFCLGTSAGGLSAGAHAATAKGIE